MNKKDLKCILHNLDNYYLELRDKLGFEDYITFGLELEFEQAMETRLQDKVNEKFYGVWDFDEEESRCYRLSEIKSPILKDNNKKIILTTSGMGSYGPAQTYIPEYISREGALIHFTGYTAEGTMGNRLKEAKNGDAVEVGGLLVKKKADVEYTTEYSAHAKADEMIEFLKQFKNLKLVLINHGEAETKETFAKRIVEEVNTKNVGLLGRQYFFRVDSYGLVKTLSTKFRQ